MEIVIGIIVYTIQYVLFLCFVTKLLDKKIKFTFNLLLCLMLYITVKSGIDGILVVDHVNFNMVSLFRGDISTSPDLHLV